MVIRKEGWDWDVPPASRAGDAAETSFNIGVGKLKAIGYVSQSGKVDTAEK
jgi:hypothetical protein